MYKLIQAINDGYRPNKHDRNTIVIFEELLERIIDFSKDTNKLVIVHDEQIYEFKDTAGKIKVKSHAR
jgi:DNA phosphorothioation-dependent restriction protein DptF